MTRCRFQECPRPSRSLGWCVRHYSRYRRCGNPAGTNRPQLPWPERFWTQVEKTTGCWHWTGALDDDGYGFITGPDGRKGGTHRLSYLMAGNALAPANVVRHSCDIRNCVNPAHLLIGTPADNVADCIERGRSRSLYGEVAPGAKLSTAQVAELRALRSAGAAQKDLAVRFGIAQSTVSVIVNFKSRVRG